MRRASMFSNPLERFERQADPPWLGFVRWAGYAAIVASVVTFLIAIVEDYVLR
jgi:hypothetical protein